MRDNEYGSSGGTRRHLESGRAQDISCRSMAGGVDFFKNQATPRARLWVTARQNAAMLDPMRARPPSRIGSDAGSDEIFELCNTRIIHSVKSEYNLNPLKRTSGDVLEELWRMVPSLGPGQALVMSPQFTHTILVDMRPSATHRRLTD